MRRLALALCVALLALAAMPAGAEIFRCTSPAGSVTYQQDPCDASERATKIDVPASYPAPDSAERQRLFAREAALDQRLEAERERWSREAIAHAMQPTPQPAPEVSAGPEILWFGAPTRFPHHRPHRPHPFAHHGAMRGGPPHG